MPLKKLHWKEGESEIRVSESNLAFPVVKRATKSPPPPPHSPFDIGFHLGCHLDFHLTASVNAPLRLIACH